MLGMWKKGVHTQIGVGIKAPPLPCKKMHDQQMNVDLFAFLKHFEYFYFFSKIIRFKDGPN